MEGLGESGNGGTDSGKGGLKETEDDVENVLEDGEDAGEEGGDGVDDGAEDAFGGVGDGWHFERSSKVMFCCSVLFARFRGRWIILLGLCYVEMVWWCLKDFPGMKN